MKKLLSVLMAILTVACFAGCGAKTEVLTMATNAEFPPYEYYDGDKVVGIDAEIAGLIAQELGMKLEIVDTDFDSIIPGVSGGKYDIGMAGMTVTEDRLQSINFTDSYATGIQTVIVAENSAIKSVDDLFAEGASHKIGVQTATTGDLYSTWDIEEAGLGSVERFNKGADAVAALVAGKVDCVIIDNEPAKAFVAANTGLKLLDTSYAVEDYAICYAKGNDELGTKINNALKKLIENGKVQEVLDKYIPAK